MNTRMLKTILVAFLGAVIWAGGTPSHALAKNGIDQVLIVSEATNSVVLEVHYTYDGNRAASVRGYMLNGGKVSPYHAFTPGAVKKGRHRTRVEIVPNRQAPALFSSDALRVSLQVQGAPRPSAIKTVSFAKTWAKPRTALRPVSTRVAAQISPKVAGTLSNANKPPLRTMVTPPKTRLQLFAKAKKSGQIGGFKTPNGTTVVYSNAQPGTPPDEAPDMQHELWARGEANRLLGIITALLGNDAGALNWYKTTEGDTASPYGQITKRTEAIAVMVAEEK